MGNKRRKRRKKFKPSFLITVFLIFAISFGAIYYTFFENKAPKEVTSETVSSEISSQPEEVFEKPVLANLVNQKNPFGNPEAAKKIMYLTFDDGPSAKITPQILDALKKEDIRATFFVLGTMARSNPEMLKRIYREGHEIALHSDSHDYGKIYKSKEAFFADFDMNEKAVMDITGFKPRIFRFPGGSNNNAFPVSLRKTIYEELKNRGYTYCDWNAGYEDAVGGTITVASILNAAKKDYSSNNVIMLAHDAAAKQSSADATGEIIQYFKNKGYDFDVLSKCSYFPQFAS